MMMTFPSFCVWMAAVSDRDVAIVMGQVHDKIITIVILESRLTLIFNLDHVTMKFKRYVLLGSM